jgi:hypothetical protein
VSEQEKTQSVVGLRNALKISLSTRKKWKSWKKDIADSTSNPEEDQAAPTAELAPYQLWRLTQLQSAGPAGVPAQLDESNARVYRSIRLSRESPAIRLLEILPGSGDHALQTRLFSVSLDQIQKFFKYDALSYCWGPQHVRRQILVNDETISIGLNLFAALISLRKSRDRQVIWADAVCIDQDNIAEKSWQLPLMHDIYACAQTVRVFLGPETTSPSTSALFDFLNRKRVTEEIPI